MISIKASYPSNTFPGRDKDKNKLLTEKGESKWQDSL